MSTGDSRAGPEARSKKQVYHKFSTFLHRYYIQGFNLDKVCSFMVQISRFWSSFLVHTHTSNTWKHWPERRVPWTRFKWGLSVCRCSVLYNRWPGTSPDLEVLCLQSAPRPCQSAPGGTGCRVSPGGGLWAAPTCDHVKIYLHLFTRTPQCWVSDLWQRLPPLSDSYIFPFMLKCLIYIYQWSKTLKPQTDEMNVTLIWKFFGL